MKFLIALLLSCTACMASPFLVMSPSPYTGTASNIASFNLFFDGATTPTSASVVLDAAGNQNMHFDLSGLTAASHTVVATAVNANGVSSAQSAPFTFSLVAPAAPAGLSVSPK